MQSEGAGPTNGGVSFWWSQVGTPTPRPPLPGSTDADVCIVGAGYTGLWTAYYLKRAQPDLRVVVLEARFAGYGASGRNGGWLTNSVTGGREQYVRAGDRGPAIAQQKALNESVTEVIEVAEREGIDAHDRPRRRARGGPQRGAAGPAAGEGGVRGDLAAHGHRAARRRRDVCARRGGRGGRQPVAPALRDASTRRGSSPVSPTRSSGSA